MLLRSFAVFLSLFLYVSGELQSSVEVVLARCRENIDWVEEMGYGPITTVYDKCKVTTGPGRHLERPNMGRESGTYLQHIVDNYENLADWTVFSQAEKPTYGYRGHRLGGGHMMRNVLFQDYVEAAETRKENPLFFIFTSVLISNKEHSYQCIRQGYGEDYTKPEGQTFAEKMCGASDHWQQWYEFPQWFSDMLQRLQKEQSAPITDFDVARAFEIFSIQPTQGVTFFAQGARFAASREAIQARPKSYYEGILEHLQQQDPWAGYYLEWMWYYILGGKDSPCGFEEPVLNGHLSWEKTSKSRQDFVALSGLSGTDESPDQGDGVYEGSVTFRVAVTVTSVNLVFNTGTLTFRSTLRVINLNIFVSGLGMRLLSTGDFECSFVQVEEFSFASTVTMKAPFRCRRRCNMQNNRGENTNSKMGCKKGGTVQGTFNGSGTLTISGAGRTFEFSFVIVLVVTITIEITFIAGDTRRTDISTLSQARACALYTPGTVALGSGSVLIADLTCSVTQAGATSYSSYIGTLSPATGILYFTGVSSASKPLFIETWSNPSATPLEVDNVTSGGSFCTNLVVYGKSGTCLTSPSATINSCSGSCSVTGSTLSSNSSLCVIQFCQTANGSGSDNGGLYGLIALVALVPLAGLIGFGVWYAMKGGAAGGEAYNQYYYPEPYPQGAYPQAAYPQAAYPSAYPAYGAEAYPFQGGFYDPGVSAPMPTPMGFSSL